MTILRMDTLTAAVALASLGARGGDLTILAQAVDEDWKRFAPDPESGSRHLISTMGNRQECPPTGLPYYNAQFIKPDRVDAKDRPMSQRFLRGAPRLCAEITRDGEGYTMSSALLQMSTTSWMTLDWDRGLATLYVEDAVLPDTALAAAIGRRMGEVVDVDHAGGMVVTAARAAGGDEIRKIANRLTGQGIAIETGLPDWTRLAFEPVYRPI